MAVSERRFKRPEAPELMKQVFRGKVYVDGKEQQIDKAGVAV